MKTSPRRIDVNVEELDRVIDRAERAPLSKADCQKLKTTLHALVEGLARHRSTEKTGAVLRPRAGVITGDAPAETEQSGGAGHGRNAASAFTGAGKVSVPHPQLQPGDACPECGEGKVYRQKEPKTLVRIVGRAPLEATVFEMERLRCNACTQVFTAEQPECAGPDKYDTTAVAMIALLKYVAGCRSTGWSGWKENWGFPYPRPLNGNWSSKPPG